MITDIIVVIIFIFIFLFFFVFSFFSRAAVKVFSILSVTFKVLEITCIYNFFFRVSFSWDV